MSTMFWIWITAALVFLIVELVTPTLIFVSFVAGALCAGIYAEIFPGSYYVQVAIFLVISLALLPLTRRLASKITKPSPQASNVDRMIGGTAIVTKTVEPDGGGLVRYEGEIWAAEAEVRIEERSRVRIVSVAGTRVRVEKQEQLNEERTE
ncbi:MAG TPA: NfeD family protein [Acidobacteriota bacterium]|nr:NfeD family protein [Acidobacteriota bacterium]